MSNLLLLETVTKVQWQQWMCICHINYYCSSLYCLGPNVILANFKKTSIILRSNCFERKCEFYVLNHVSLSLPFSLCLLVLVCDNRTSGMWNVKDAGESFLLKARALWRKLWEFLLWRCFNTQVIYSTVWPWCRAGKLYFFSSYFSSAVAWFSNDFWSSLATQRQQGLQFFSIHVAIIAVFRE